MTDQPLALVLGATGGVGGETARALARHGWRVRALTRDAARAAKRDASFDWVAGDAMDREAVVAAAKGARLIVHAVNPPGYRNWGGLVLPMIDNTIAAAEATGATIFLPGTIYNYGPDAFPLLSEDSPQNATTRKGRIRVALEQRLEAASRRGVRSLVLRAGDFFGPRPGNSWLSQGMAPAGKPLTAITNPGKAGVGHSWAYLPDVAETFARLADRLDDLAPFERLHFEGFWGAEGVGMAQAIRVAAGQPDLPIKAFPWAALWLAAPVSETLRELAVMKPLWRAPARLDNRRLVALLGEEPRTPLVEAVRASLRGTGVLRAAQGSNRVSFSGLRMT